MSKVIQIDEDRYKQLKKLYEDNKDTPEKVLQIKEGPIVVNYLKFVLQHYENLSEEDKRNMI